MKGASLTEEEKEGIDDKILPVVEYLNERGYETTASCQGGEGHQSNKPYINIKTKYPNDYYYHQYESINVGRELQEAGVTGFNTSAQNSFQSDGRWKPEKHSKIVINFWSDIDQILGEFQPEGTNTCLRDSEKLKSVVEPDFEFTGHDYSELAIAWGLIDRHCTRNDRLSADQIKRHLLNLDIKKDKTPDEIKDCRRFLKCLYDSSVKLDYSHPMWKGLLDIEDDYTFRSYFVRLIRSMWT